MDKSTPLTLVAVTYSIDSIGQRVPSETQTNVYCNLRSVTRDEWKNAGEMGFKATYQATMFAPDYAGQKEVILDSKRYGVYRTYLASNDNIELYLEEKVGV